MRDVNQQLRRYDYATGLPAQSLQKKQNQKEKAHPQRAELRSQQLERL